MSISAWVHHVGPDPSGVSQAITARLVQIGVNVCDCGPEGVSACGVLLCDEFHDEMVAVLREHARVAQCRVLVGCCKRITTVHAQALIKAGAADVMSCLDHSTSPQEIFARLSRWHAIEEVMGAPDIKHKLVGESVAWKGVLRQVVEVAHFTDAPVLILGESGTGKELVARLIHDIGVRKSTKELVVLDCSTVVPELSGSEFFGHERGAFTGAVSSRDGAFALADEGTLFLDEVGELSPPMQTQLLRVIQEQTYKRVGGNTWQKTRFRLVCATNRDLLDLAQIGGFRADLFYRIAGFVCCLPPLRERKEDVIPLARHFLQQMYSHKSAPPFDPSVQEYLLKRDYPGNVRELRQVVGRMLCRYPGEGPVTLGCILPDEAQAWNTDDSVWCDQHFEISIRRALLQGAGLKHISRTAEETAIRIAVEETGGNLQQAAQSLGVTDRTLQMRRAARRQE